MVFGCQMDSALRQDNSFCPSAFQQVLHPPFSVNWCYIICIICKTILPYISDNIHIFLNIFRCFCERAFFVNIRGEM